MGNAVSLVFSSKLNLGPCQRRLRFRHGVCTLHSKVIKLRWKSGLKSQESWSNVTEVGTEVLLGSNLSDILAAFDQGSVPQPPRLPPQFGDL